MGKNEDRGPRKRRRKIIATTSRWQAEERQLHSMPMEESEKARLFARAITSDRLWHVAAYRKSLQLIDLALSDTTLVSRSRLHEPTSRQLYRAIGSIGANIAEGYSRSSGRDRARFFEYGLGSVRESLVWYYAIRTVLTEEAAADRATRIVDLRRLLLASVNRERHRGRITDRDTRPGE
jgi:four helix bundle protein